MTLDPRRSPNENLLLVEQLPAALFMFARDNEASLLVSSVDLLFSPSDDDITAGWGIVIVREDVKLGEGYGKTLMDAARAALANARQLESSEGIQLGERSN